MSGLDRNPLIGVTGPVDTFTACAQVLEVVDLATGWTEDCTDQNRAMGYHLILKTVRNALYWEAEHFQERTKPEGKVAQLPGRK